jgi:hypothetical protein
MPSRVVIGSLWLAFLVGCMLVPANAGAATVVYTLDGSDAFRIAARQLQSLITYSGIERLTTQAAGDATIFHATVTYAKDDGATKTHAHAAFALTMSPAGDVSDEHDADPDYLTILNQPFSVQLDGPTMRDLHGLTRAIPFDFPSPMTGAPLHGTLRRLLDGSLAGVRVLGIAFSARGPLAGTLPDRPSLALSGDIKMNGTAYYAYANALLLALDATLLIEGKVGGPAGNDTVTITYKRSIRQAPVERPGR